MTERSAPPRWFPDARESRTYYRSADDWEFHLSPPSDGEARVSVALNRGDTPVYPEAARWLSTTMKKVAGARATWVGEFHFPAEHLDAVEGVLASSFELASRAVELQTLPDIAEFLASRPARLVDEDLRWRLVHHEGAQLFARVRLVRFDGYEVQCERDGLGWDGTSNEDWPRELVAPASWRDFRRAVLESRAGRERPGRATIDALLFTFAASEGLRLSKFEGSWTTAIVNWRSR